MQAALTDLLAQLTPQPLGQDRFLMPSVDLGWGQVFGGQVLGQALAAAGATVDGARPANSLHGYFLQRGDPRQDVVYEVDRLRDGSSFATRRVLGRQGDTPIFCLSASFHREEPGLEHQDPAPHAPPPSALLSDQERLRQQLDRLPPALMRRALDERAIEARPVDPIDAMRPEARTADGLVWLRASDRLPDDPAVHQRLLAYASDFYLLTISLRPHAVSWLTPGMQVASLDHAMWFHRPFRADEWLLYAMHSPTAAGARAVVQGRVFDQAGRLVASTAQEGLVRRKEPRPHTG